MSEKKYFHWVQSNFWDIERYWQLFWEKRDVCHREDDIFEWSPLRSFCQMQNENLRSHKVNGWFHLLTLAALSYLLWEPKEETCTVSQLLHFSDYDLTERESVRFLFFLQSVFHRIYLTTHITNLVLFLTRVTMMIVHTNNCKIFQKKATIVDNVFIFVMFLKNFQD